MGLFLTSDIGGTKTRLALVKVNGNHVEILREHIYTSQHHNAFETLLDDFLSLGDILTIRLLALPPWYRIAWRKRLTCLGGLMLPRCANVSVFCAAIC
jgi:Glucokinase